MIGSHPKPLTRCVDKTMGLALWKMSGVLIITKVEIKAFVVPAKGYQRMSGDISVCCVQENRTARGTW